MALVGNLRDLKLANLIQLNCMEKNTAKLTIEHAGKYGIIYFHGGQIVHAEYDPDIGDNAVYRLLTLEEGNFKVEGGVRSPALTVESSWSNILLEGLHQIDHRKSAEDGINQHLLEMLMNIKGVERAAVISANGSAITSNFTDPDGFVLGAWTVLEINQLISEAQLGTKDFITVVSDKNRLLLREYNDQIMYIELAAKIQIDTILPFIQKAFATG